MVSIVIYRVTDRKNMLREKICASPFHAMDANLALPVIKTQIDFYEL